MVGAERIQMNGAIGANELVSLVQGYMEDIWEHLSSLGIVLGRCPVSMETVLGVRWTWMRMDGTTDTFLGEIQA
jgi:hypothetical protein